MAICTLECIFLSSMSFKLCKLFCSLWEDIIWIKDLNYTTILNTTSFESLKVHPRIHDKQLSACYLNKLLFGLLCRKFVYGNFIFNSNPNMIYMLSNHSFILEKRILHVIFLKCIYYFHFFAYYWMYCSILVCIIMYCVLSKSNDMFVDTLCLFCFYLKMMAGASRKLHHWVDKHNLRHFLWCHLG